MVIGKDMDGAFLDLVNTHHSSEVKDKINEECIYWYKAATNIDICNPTLSGKYPV